MAVNIGDFPSTFFKGLSDFWLRFFRDTVDLEAFYQASEIYLGDAYLDLLSSILNIGLVDTPVFNKEYWKLMAIREDELSFVEGLTTADNRFFYDMPGSIVRATILQNTILNPSLLLEHDVEFECLSDDGFLRFKSDIFRAVTDPEGNILPLSGVAWRYITLQTGNRFTDSRRITSWYTDSNVQRGDILSILAYKGSRIGGLQSNGSIVYTGIETQFISPPAGLDFTSANVGDLIRVYGSTTIFNGYYVIKSVVSPKVVVLENTTYIPTVSSAPASLSWELYKGIWLDKAENHRIDYVDDKYLIGDIEDPYPLTYNTELISTVVRDTPSGEVHGRVLTPSTIIASGLGDAVLSIVSGNVRVTVPGPGPFTAAMTIIPGSTVADYYWVSLNGLYAGSYYIKTWISNEEVELGISATEMGLVLPTVDVDWKLSQTPVSTLLGCKHVVEDSFITYARDIFGGILIKDTDYTIDYFRGVFTPLRPIDPSGIHTADFRYRKELIFSSDGSIEEYTQGRVKQMSFWVPEVWKDKFNLYYNYGSMLNRFQASSEAYKTFLRGILYLYVTGPILQRIEAALNVAAGYVVVHTDGEILAGYDNGQISSGIDGQFVDAYTDPLKPFDHFISLSYSFTETDLGSYLVIPDAINDVNKGKFKILDIIDANTVEVETSYGVVNESPLDWELTKTYIKRVTTNADTYDFPYNVPIRADVQDPMNIGQLTFVAFEPLTDAFKVTDYVEDPYWWHNKEIPNLFWKDETRQRRLASTQLYEHIIGPVDDARIGDPGLYIGADDEGIIAGSGAPVRHCAAFVIFDRYLKFHMFYIQFHPDLGLSSEFITDLQDLILVVKPSYTYPYVDPAAQLEDMLALLEEFQENYGLHYGDEEELEISDNALVIGGTGNFMSFGDYFRYDDYTAEDTGEISPPPVFFDLAIPAGQRVIKLRLNATRDGKQVEEGVDYTFDYDPTSLTAWRVIPTVYPIGEPGWDAAPSITFDAVVIEVVNLISVPIPDTRLGFTPLIIGGTDPGYIRKDITSVSAKTEYIDRTVSLLVDVDPVGGSSPYIYP